MSDRDTIPERIAMCAHPDGPHEHVPLRPGEAVPTTCFMDCDCTPVEYVRADRVAGVGDMRTGTGNIGRTTIYVCPFCGAQHLDRYETRSPRCPHRGDHFEPVEMIPAAGVLPAGEADRLRAGGLQLDLVIRRLSADYMGAVEALERIAHHEREGDYPGQVNAMRAIATGFLDSLGDMSDQGTGACRQP